MSPRSLGSSALFHAVLILLVVFGLPSIFMPDEPLYQPQAISVELLPIASKNNAPNRTPKPPKRPVEQAKPVVKKEPVKKPEPPKKEEPKKEEKKPDPKPEQVKKPEPKKEEKTPEPKKEEVKKEEPKKDEKSFDELMKDLEKDTPKEEAPAEKGETIISDEIPDPTAPLSQTVENSIRNQVMACWNYPSGAKDQETLVAHLQVSLREDGSVADIKLPLGDQIRYKNEREFKALVDSAKRALANPKCVPLKDLPVNAYNSWSKVELVFDPDEMW